MKSTTQKFEKKSVDSVILMATLKIHLLPSPMLWQACNTSLERNSILRTTVYRIECFLSSRRIVIDFQHSTTDSPTEKLCISVGDEQACSTLPAGY